MRTRLFVLSILCLVVVGLSSFPAVSFATESDGTLFTDINEQTSALGGEDGAAYTITSDPRYVIVRLIGIASTFIGFGFLFYTFYGGVTIALSAGREEMVKQGKSTILTGTVGVLIMLMSYSLTVLIVGSLQRAAELTTGDCDDGDCYFIEPTNEVNPDPFGSVPSESDSSIWQFLGGNAEDEES